MNDEYENASTGRQLSIKAGDAPGVRFHHIQEADMDGENCTNLWLEDDKVQSYVDDLVANGWVKR
tara:strand:- start:2071 stop:2265 length:195 start_codon:yes stop_codon:yes gene_type:complete